MYTIAKNEEHNSLEISFDGKPSEEIRAALKSLRFRWHGVKKVWYGYADEETVKKAIESPKTESSKAPVNKFGIKVGDVFCASWGYDQTNVDFFQVIALAGASSVRVRGVHPKAIESSAISPMSEDVTYQMPHTILPPVHSVFIKDPEKGDLKRVSKSGESVFFSISSYANAYKVNGETCKQYVSWYA